ncbi:hypothetical protein BKA82DRAFT_997770 [Pisolithus tinctorius]|uniref:Uncharacterized protein n=1 Tax=Pisolithus tinctorius Marx 270 TaxID=870435 RepID=A0A0C3PGR5_PISTI|nr:hypothetical protein BKA82DRAFT_997770 [Pisolithus tinctorius]KIO07581.1 hypothetical protein M404DRAFT_997770 [Pisolithus tinctorius Marx 270]
MCSQSIVVVTEGLGSVSDFRRTYGHRFPFAKPAPTSEEAGLFIQASVNDYCDCSANCSHTQIQLETVQEQKDILPDKFSKTPSVPHSTSKSVKQIYALSPSSVVSVGVSENEPVIGFVIPSASTEHDRVAVAQALNSLPGVPNSVLPEPHSQIFGEEPTSPVTKVESVHGTTCLPSLPASSTLLRTAPPPIPSPSPPSTPTSSPCFLKEHNCYIYLDNGQFYF